MVEIDKDIATAEQLKEIGLHNFAKVYVKKASDALDRRDRLKSAKKYKNNITPEMVAEAKLVPIESLGLLDKIGQEAGDRLRALCPFHDDTKPSLVIYKETNSYHCFVCTNGGDNIKLVQEKLKLSFIDAVKYLLKI